LPLSITRGPWHESHQAAEDAALVPGRLPGTDHSAASLGSKRAQERDSAAAAADNERDGQDKGDSGRYVRLPARLSAGRFVGSHP